MNFFFNIATDEANFYKNQSKLKLEKNYFYQLKKVKSLKIKILILRIIIILVPIIIINYNNNNIIHTYRQRISYSSSKYKT